MFRFWDKEEEVEEVKVRTVEEEIAFLFGEKHRLIAVMEEAARARRVKRKADLATTSEFEAVVDKLRTYGIKN